MLICKIFLFYCHSCHKLCNLLVNVLKEHHPFSRNVILCRKTFDVFDVCFTNIFLDDALLYSKLHVSPSPFCLLLLARFSNHLYSAPTSRPSCLNNEGWILFPRDLSSRLTTFSESSLLFRTERGTGRDTFC